MCTTSYDDQSAEVGDPVTTSAGTFRVRVEYDHDGTNPRTDFDQLGTMVCSHRRYDLPREGNLTAEIDDAFDRGGLRLAARYLCVVHGAVVLPVYGYDHGQLRLKAGKRTGAFADPWDSGIAGVIYARRADIAREWVGNGSAMPSDDEIAGWLANEVEQYDTWANGEMTGYVVERATCPEADHADCGSECWQLIDSCWGYYSVAEAMEQGRAAVPESLSDYDLAALAALDAARRACGIADSDSLASEANGACGAVVDAFRSAAADLLGEWMADRLYALLVSTGDGDVSACLARVAIEPDCDAS
jgi:hypothetical protein